MEYKKRLPKILIVTEKLLTGFDAPILLAQLKASDISDTVKVLNLSKALGTAVREKSAQLPFLLSIGERADKVIQAYENRQLNTQEALTQLEQIATECVDAESAHQQLNVDENTFAIYTVLKQVVDNLDVTQARSIMVGIAQHLLEHQSSFL